MYRTVPAPPGVFLPNRQGEEAVNSNLVKVSSQVIIFVYPQLRTQVRPWAKASAATSSCPTPRASTC